MSFRLVHCSDFGAHLKIAVFSREKHVFDHKLLLKSQKFKNLSRWFVEFFIAILSVYQTCISAQHKKMPRDFTDIFSAKCNKLPEKWVEYLF